MSSSSRLVHSAHSQSSIKFAAWLVLPRDLEAHVCPSVAISVHNRVSSHNHIETTNAARVPRQSLDGGYSSLPARNSWLDATWRRPLIWGSNRVETMMNLQLEPRYDCKMWRSASADIIVLCIQIDGPRFGRTSIHIPYRSFSTSSFRRTLLDSQASSTLSLRRSLPIFSCHRRYLRLICLDRSSTSASSSLSVFSPVVPALL